MDQMSDPTAPGSASDPRLTAAPSARGPDRKAQRNQPWVRRRNRTINSCLECRRRKLKCDKQQPCTNCVKFIRPCVFIASGHDPEAQAKLAEVKEKMGILERTLEADAVRRSFTSLSPESPEQGAPPESRRDLAHGDQGEDEDAKDFDTTALASEYVTYYEDEDNDDIVDLGIALGKLRMTERIGGMVRPRFSEELAQALKDMPQSDSSNPFATQSPQSWMIPGSDYIAPASGLLFAQGATNLSLTSYLPCKVLVDRLLSHYWKAVHIVTCTVHRPSFERCIGLFWENVATGHETRASFQAVLFAALLSSVVSMSEAKVLADFGVDRRSLIDNFRLATESALTKANFLRTTKLETLQAFVMYLIPLCRAEISRAHSALAGTCIRLAECMGLHRDPASFSTNPIEIQIRRLLWFQIAFLDVRTSEVTGPRPQIRLDEYDTHFPLNVDDLELEQALETGQQVTQDSDSFTSTTITRMRIECFEMIRSLMIERLKIVGQTKTGEKKTTLMSVLSQIQAFHESMEKTYVPLLNRTNPQHLLAMEMYGIISARMYIMVLHPFASNDKRNMPERLRRLMMSSCIMALEHSMAIEQEPALAQWSWYLGATQQYQPALLLISEIYVQQPEPALAARIWRCLDFVFDFPTDLDPIHKTRMLLEELYKRSATYAALRRMRTPPDMPRVGPRAPLEMNMENEKERSSEIRAVEDRERSRSLQSTTSDPAGGYSPLAQHQHRSMQRKPPAAYYPSLLPMKAPIGAIPQVDWGDIDLEALSAQPAPALQTNSAGAYSSGGTGLATPKEDSKSAVLGTQTGMIPPTASTRKGAAGVGSSPMETVLNEIDWNEWDRLFGNAEQGSDSIVIPPFTFPTFEYSDLQWLNTDSGAR